MARLPTAVLTQDTITVPTEEYASALTTVSPSTLTITASLSAPTPNVYSLPATLAGTLALNAPTVLTGPTVSTLALTGSIGDPTPNITQEPGTVTGTMVLETSTASPTFLDATQALSMSVIAPLVNVYDLPSTLALSLTVNAPTIVTNVVVANDLGLSATVYAPTPAPTVPTSTLAASLAILAALPEGSEDGALVNLTLSINVPTVSITRRVGILGLTLGGAGQLAPSIGFMNPTIVRRIKDPLAKGGCPQCGTFLYDKGREIPTKQVLHGRNLESRQEDQYIRCARCNYPVQVYRRPSYPEGSWAGWGLTYEEIEAGESDISYP